MKRVTASQARRDWFRLLDAAAAGEAFVVDRHGQRIVIRREPKRAKASPPSYSKLIRARGGDDADLWSWTWSPDGELSLKERKRR